MFRKWTKFRVDSLIHRTKTWSNGSSTWKLSLLLIWFIRLKLYSPEKLISPCVAFTFTWFKKISLPRCFQSVTKNKSCMLCDCGYYEVFISVSTRNNSASRTFTLLFNPSYLSTTTKQALWISETDCHSSSLQFAKRDKAKIPAKLKKGSIQREAINEQELYVFLQSWFVTQSVLK